MTHLESTIKTQIVISQSSRTILKTAGINSFFMAIMALLTYLNLLQSFIASALKLGGATVIEKKTSSHDHIMDQISWNNKYLISMTNLNFVKCHYGWNHKY